MLLIERCLLSGLVEGPSSEVELREVVSVSIEFAIGGEFNEGELIEGELLADILDFGSVNIDMPQRGRTTCLVMAIPNADNLACLPYSLHKNQSLDLVKSCPLKLNCYTNPDDYQNR